jgi:hypothetical protein
MKNNQKCSHKLLIILTTCGLLTLIPLSTYAKGVTQLKFLQTLVQVSGDAGQFGASATAADYIQWAQAKGMNPASGWNPSANLSQAELAQLLVQLLNLNPKKGGADYIRILQREGIGFSADEEITPASIARFFDSGLTMRIASVGSPVKGENGNGLGPDGLPNNNPPPNNPNGDPHINPPGNSGNAPGHNK